MLRQEKPCPCGGKAKSPHDKSIINELWQFILERDRQADKRPPPPSELEQLPPFDPTHSPPKFELSNTNENERFRSLASRINTFFENHRLDGPLQDDQWNWFVDVLQDLYQFGREFRYYPVVVGLIYLLVTVAVARFPAREDQDDTRLHLIKFADKIQQEHPNVSSILVFWLFNTQLNIGTLSANDKSSSRLKFACQVQQDIRSKKKTTSIQDLGSQQEMHLSEKIVVMWKLFTDMESGRRAVAYLLEQPEIDFDDNPYNSDFHRRCERDLLVKFGPSCVEKGIVSDRQKENLQKLLEQHFVSSNGKRAVAKAINQLGERFWRHQPMLFITIRSFLSLEETLDSMPSDMRDAAVNFAQHCVFTDDESEEEAYD